MIGTSKQIDEELNRQRRVAEENDAKRRATRAKLPYLDLIVSKIPVNLKALRLLKEEDAKNALIAPFEISRKKLLVAAFDPLSAKTTEIIDDLKKNQQVNVFVCSQTSLNYIWGYYQFITEVKEISGSVEINPEHLKDLIKKIKTIQDLTEQISSHEDRYTSEMLEIILAGGLTLFASDIHLEAGERGSTARVRIDGVLHTVYEAFSEHIYHSIVTRIKLLSSLKLNIHDEAQDGRFTIHVEGKSIEVRTSVIPSEYGETVVMRLLDPSSLKNNLEELGWRPDLLEKVKKHIEEPNGLILNTGPTGSGKTTTLYAFLRHVQNSEIKIITIEDPIEYHLDGISQTQVDSHAGYTFASGLRSILRQDPDIVLVGEIRDDETADIALNAALTGHLVFSTLHTNDAIGTIPRLLDLGAKAQIIGPALRLVIAQRLVRLLCPFCKKKQNISEDQKKKIELFIEQLPNVIDKNEYKEFEIFSADGCEKCQGIGYKGRISIFELFSVSDAIEALIYKNPSEIEIKKAVREENMIFLQEDGILKILKGLTSFDEVEKHTGLIEWWDKK